ncbi:MAG: hypothetical protein ACOY5R_10565 [Pseudomonadota bacterium]
MDPSYYRLRMDASYAAAAAATHPAARSAHLRLAKAYGKLLGAEAVIGCGSARTPENVSRQEDRRTSLEGWENEGGPAGVNRT